jgi:Uncharacterized conserved protein
MSRITIRTRNSEYTAELDRSDISNEIWLSLPLKADINMLGSQLYFSMPLESKTVGDTTVLEVGDIAYWPKADAFCIFFGSTPLSGDDGKPVSAFPVKVIGRVIGDCSSMEHAGDRMPIRLERSF